MRLVLDTHPIVAFFNEEKESGRVEKLLKGIENSSIKGFVSSVTISELFYIIARLRSAEFSEAVINYVKASKITVVPLSGGIAEKAGLLKFKYSGSEPKGMPLADCMIAATAIEKKAKLVTTDPHFRKIKELKVKRL